MEGHIRRGIKYREGDIDGKDIIWKRDYIKVRKDIQREKTNVNLYK